ncbi:MAG: M48 family metallopeptidase, partial [Bacteroidaceae bacterium]|nr:M48 family metallopeptidase [Bacteroidaceae bacterium]
MKAIRPLLIAALALLTAACGTTNTVPITGRKTRLLVDDAQILSLSTQQYQEYMQGATLSTNQTNTAMVKRVGQRLATAVETFLQNNGYAQELQNFQWEFNLVNSKEANAFCMPGGKIVVYEGMLPITQDETSLAIVLGHEIAHAVAKHSAEQLSKQTRQQYAAQIGGSVLTQVANTKGLGGYAQLLDMVAQTGFNFANLKYSRDNETEADRLGLIFAAMAGYDPQLAIPFWQRMAES